MSTPSTRRSPGGIALLVLLLVAASLAVAPRASAASDSFAGAVDESGDRFDAYFIDVTDVGPIEATLAWTDTSADLNLFIKDPTNTGVANSTSNSANPEVVSFYATAADLGTWTIRVKAKTGASDYTLDVTHSNGEPPDPPGQTFTGNGNAASDPWNAHKLQITEPGVIDASLDWADAGADLRILLKNPQGVTLASADSNNKPEVLSHSVTQTGQYKLVAVFDSGASDYTITWDFTPGTPTGLATYETAFGYKQRGYYSTDQARERFHVIINPDTLQLDEAATAKLRNSVS